MDHYFSTLPLPDIRKMQSHIVNLTKDYINDCAEAYVIIDTLDIKVANLQSIQKELRAEIAQLRTENELLRKANNGDSIETEELIEVQPRECDSNVLKSANHSQINISSS